MENGTAETVTAIEPYIQGLRVFARSLLRGDHERADDLVQDSLERALSHWHKRRRDGDLRSWLFTILYNRFVTEQYRRRREFAHRSFDDVALEDLPGFEGAQEPALAYRDLLRGFAELPPDQRAVLLLIGIEDFSYEEAARILGIPVGTVMSRLSRGRERLRRYMNEGLPRTDKSPPSEAASQFTARGGLAAAPFCRGDSIGDSRGLARLGEQIGSRQALDA
jgi:RNA polymerase sigma-70 factor, ECF subfamily